MVEQSQLTNHPVHLFNVVAVETVKTLAGEGGVPEERRVDVSHRKEEEERTMGIPAAERGKKTDRKMKNVKRSADESEIFKKRFYLGGFR